MSDKETVMHFAQDVLGCGCHESVFDDIGIETDVNIGDGIRVDTSIRIGGRLLVHVIMSGDMDEYTLLMVLRRGKEERDRKAFNRYRLVVVSDTVLETEGLLGPVFNKWPERDERTHLHVIGEKDVPEL